MSSLVKKGLVLTDSETTQPTEAGLAAFLESRNEPCDTTPKEVNHKSTIVEPQPVPQEEETMSKLIINVAEATTKDLVEFYNAHAEKPVKKFADRKTAERRVNELLATLTPTEPEAPVEPTPTPTTGKKAKAAVKVDGKGEYSSLKVAFEELGLQMGVHQGFRKALKAEGTKVYDRDGKTFTFHATHK